MQTVIFVPFQNGVKKLFFVLFIFGGLYYAASCSRFPGNPEKARLRALAIAQKTFKKDARNVIRVTEYLPYSESGCVSYGNNGRYMVILRGNGLDRSHKVNSFRASFDVDLTGLPTEVRSILVDLQSANDKGE